VNLRTAEPGIYQYLFSQELYEDWSWSQRFPDQPEIERWMHYVTDRLDLRRDIQFSTTVTGARFDEERGRWTVETDRGETIDTQFLVTCAGMLSAPLTDVFPGQDTFRGTSSTPHAGRPRGSISTASGSAWWASARPASR
jgi:acetone monooxygenase (methyl acetate-forming)